MAGDIEGVASGLADIATGGLIALTVEPAADSPARAEEGHTHEGACLNCGTPLIGPHCHACGQRAHVHRTISAFFHDLLHGVLHFEGKTWRTIPMLAWKPGQLTREYIDGKRARYVSPIALFLFVVFLTYAGFNALGGSGAIAPEMRGIEAAKAEYAANEKTLARLRAERSQPATSARETTRIDRKIAEIEDEQKGLSLITGGDPAREFTGGLAENRLPRDSSLARAIDTIRENPELVLYKTQANAYKYSWMLIPLSVPFVWLLFPFSRRFRGYDHTVFATYSITFMIALASVASLLFFVNLGTLGGLLLLYAPYHMYRQLRGTYDLGRFGALWRMLALSLFAWIAIGVFVAAIGAMAAGH
jgi:hypothetical protein